MEIEIVQDPGGLASRALAYGDGCFTTAKVENGEISLLPLHMQRLQSTAMQLQLSVQTWQWQLLLDEMATLAKERGQGVLKVILCARPSTRGYARSGDEATAIISFLPPVTGYKDLADSGVVLGLAELRLSINPALAGLKHLNRLEQVLVKNELLGKGVFDKIVTDADGIMVETSSANLFWSNGHCWFTPEICYAGVCGVMRNHILGLITATDTPLQTMRAVPAALGAANDVFICNSLMGIVPVTEFKMDKDTSMQFSNDALLPMLMQTMENA